MRNVRALRIKRICQLNAEGVIRGYSYLAHRTEVGPRVGQNRAKFDALCLQARAAHPLLYQKLEEVQDVPS